MNFQIYKKKLQGLCGGAEPFNENDLLRILNGKGSGGGGGGRVSGGGGATMMLPHCQVNKPDEKEVKQARLEYLQELLNNAPDDEKENIKDAIAKLKEELNKIGGGKYPKKSKSKSKKSKKSKSKKSKSKKSKKSKSKKQ